MGPESGLGTRPGLCSVPWMILAWMSLQKEKEESVASLSLSLSRLNGLNRKTTFHNE